ncbi:hypothetical protein [Longispora albida]|uniref:hypothetical protein n=1 Tax=Longispora albida TaxID=203523 RepID=UPI00036EF56A|nr:hypothetical protein [Longispora albida]
MARQTDPQRDQPGQQPAQPGRQEDPARREDPMQQPGRKESGQPSKQEPGKSGKPGATGHDKM